MLPNVSGLGENCGEIYLTNMYLKLKSKKVILNNAYIVSIINIRVKYFVKYFKAKQ